MKKCYECGRVGAFNEGTSTEQIKVGSQLFNVEVKGQRCACGAIYIPAAEVEKADRVVARWLAENSACDVDAFRFMRKAIGLKSVELADLFGVTPTTVSRWENEQVPLDRQSWALLCAIVLDTLQGSTATKDRLAKKSPSHSVEPAPVRLAS